MTSRGHADAAQVVFLSSLFPLNREDTTGIFNFQQLRALAQDMPLHVYVPVPWRVWSVRMRAFDPDYFVAHGLQVTPFRYYYVPGSRGRFLYWGMLLSALPLFFQLKRRPVSAVIASWLFPDALVGARLARYIGARSLLKVHGSDVQAIRAGDYVARKAKRESERGARFVAVSHALKQQLVTHGVPSQCVDVVHNGIDVDLFRPGDRAASRNALGLPAQGSIALYVGNLKRQKGIFDFLEAISLLDESICPQAVVVGDGPDRQAAHQYAEQLGLAARVRWVGRVPHSEMPQWFHAASVLMLPSYSEGRPNVVVEAQASGLPVVATDVGGTSEALDLNSGSLVSAGKPAELARACTELLARPVPNQALGDACSWQHSGRALLRALKPDGDPAP